MIGECSGTDPRDIYQISTVRIHFVGAAEKTSIQDKAYRHILIDLLADGPLVVWVASGAIVALQDILPFQLEK